MRANREPVKHARRVFVRGKLRPVHDPKPCTHGWHTGQPRDADVFDRAGGVWSGQATCSACGSTVDRSEFARVA